ncbi:prephenate dehydrogenase [Nakamurella sp.]|uniref:prephenate dehydrogenase n=1 Tax=Nakamurella sp. TaxID=1869182 RepID=UPI003B3B0D22
MDAGAAPTDLARLLPPSVCVLGLGLIGGSLARAAGPFLPVSGWSPSPATRDAAAADGLAVAASLPAALRAAVAQDALVVLAAPVTSFPELLRAVDEHAPTVRLTDVASIKAVVAEQVDALAPRARFIGAHPRAGTAHSGWAAGDPRLFDGAAWVTCLTEESEPADWSAVAALALAVGSRVVPAEAAAHDSAVARISHLPHVMALALAQVGAQGGALALALAASSFADGTRVAGTRPELIRAMCEGNRDALVEALDDALGLMGVARGSLASTGSLRKLTEGGHAARGEFEARAAGLEPMTLTGDDLIEQLLAVGSAGGYVTGLRGTTDDLRIDVQYPDRD